MTRKSQNHKSPTSAVLGETPPHRVTTSKQDIVITLLKREEGASLDELVQATGWRKHSVRGLISGALKKKQRLNVVTERTAEGPVYSIVAAAVETTDAG